MDKGAKVLTKLCELDFDAIEAYEEAIQRLEDKGVADKLAEFRADHLSHTDALNKLITARNEEPVSGPDAKRLLTEGKVVIADLLGDKAILKAMVANEKVTKKAYDEARDSDSLSPEEKAQVTKHFEDEKRHHDWISSTSEKM
ncbi:PA2169 family four-helix-bundle protein [Alteromonas sp. ASW11-19]|uniref:PA2169 family four-helix-bundle protein n=1 Tax=Alteromonas salexigens TaxID=2982530 RepID=A0ABT2VPP7_9ALTE|nr:PA2169 family four-helix-bundle protein [Alteromonas salexigens]MCU7555267.1 PA2169 family four-helix-bundle protein [Alteromonas salexigens]